MRGNSTLHNQVILNCAKAAISKSLAVTIGKPEKSDGIFSKLKNQQYFCDQLAQSLQAGHILSKQDIKRIQNIDLVGLKK
jgi:hypothetical protein